MANEIEIVKHIKKTRANLPATLESTTIYFVTDEKKIQLGNDDYTGVTGITVNSGSKQTGDVSLTIPTQATDINAVPKPSSATENNLALFDGSKGIKDGEYYISTQAPSSSSGHTSLPTSKAVWDAINNGIAVNDAMRYMGAISGDTTTHSYGGLTPKADKGDTYKVSVAGKVNGVDVKIGDLLICNTDNTAAATSSNYSTIKANWDYINVKDTDSTYKFTIGTTTRGDANGTDLGTLKKETEANGGTTLSLVETGDIFRWNRKTSKVDGLSGAEINHFVTCSTSAATAQKEVTISVANGTFTLDAGAKVSVKFTYANTASNPTLKVGSNAAKNIFNKGSRITTGDNKALLCGVCDFIYDGTQFHLIGNYVGETQTLAVNDMDARVELSGGENNYVGFSSPSAGKLKLTDVDSNEIEVTILNTAQPKTTQNPSGRAGYLSADDMTRFELMWDALLWG